MIGLPVRVSSMLVEECQMESTGVNQVHVPYLGSSHGLVFLMLAAM